MNYFNLLWNLYQLKRNTGMRREQLITLQEKKLRELLVYAYDNSTYYHRVFEEAGITRKQIPLMPLSAFPVLDKQLLMEHFNELVTVSDLKQEDLRRFDREESTEQKKFKDEYHVVHSSGSTGTPGYFVYDEAAWSQMLLGIIRAALWDMTMPQILKLLWKGPRIVYIAATDGRYGGAMAVGDGIEGVHADQLFLDVKTPLAAWIRQIKEFKPNMVIGYPSAIKILGELVEKGEVSVDIFRIVSCGEPLGASLRNYLETIFEADVVNIYGASESLALGVETSHAEGMYLFDDLNYIEVENGAMYLTSLYNYVQPLIRYRISDQLNLREPEDGREVSGGEAQRAAIARAMINEPGIIFADEPTGALNKRNTGEVLDLLTELNKEGQSILLVTHDLRAAVRGTRLLYLEDGKILDELSMPVFHPEDERTREAAINDWLASFQW